MLRSCQANRLRWSPGNRGLHVAIILFFFIKIGNSISFSQWVFPGTRTRHLVHLCDIFSVQNEVKMNSERNGSNYSKLNTELKSLFAEMKNEIEWNKNSEKETFKRFML